MELTLFKSKSSLFYILTALCCVFFSCSNLIDNASLEKGRNNNSSNSYICVFGNIDCSNPGLESEVLQAGTNTEKSHINSLGRYAVPVITVDTNSSGTSEYVYYVIATATGQEDVSGSVDSSLNYSIELRTGFTWTIEVGIKRRSDDVVVLSGSAELALSSSESVMSKDIILQPAEGTGSIELGIDSDSSITSVSFVIDDSSMQTKWDAALADTGSFTKEEINISAIPSGIYSGTINFYKGSVVIYSVSQAINVLPGVQTNKWFSSSASSSVIDSNGKLSTALIKKRNRIVYYVNSESGNDDNEGSHYYPLAKLDVAIQRIDEAGNTDVDYTIYIDGTQAGTFTIETANMKSLKICKAKDAATCVLDGEKSSLKSVLDIATTKPVTIKGLTITNAMYHGLHLGANSTVTLGEGVRVSGNCTQETGTQLNGAGICMETGSVLYMCDDAQVENNTASKFGGGIDCYGIIYLGYKDSVTPDESFTGGISNNIANYGGGIYLEGNSSLYMYKGHIDRNTALIKEGGGIRCGGTNTITILGGTVSENVCSALNEDGKGGAVYIGVGSVLNMFGGTFENNSSTIGGAVYVRGEVNLKGSAYIPISNDRKNDISLESSSYVIKVAGSLNPPIEASGKTATITPSAYSVGLKVVEAADGVTLSNEVSKFDITPYVDAVTTEVTNYSIDDQGKLYVSEITSNNVESIISNLTSSSTIKLSDSLSSSKLDEIADAIRNLPDGVLVFLDLDDVTGLDRVSDSCFKDCKNLTSIELPDSITSIEAAAFSGCSTLFSIGLPANLSMINMNTFSDCISLGAIEIPASVTRIGMEAFENCTALKNVVIRGTEPIKLQAIDTCAFKNCSELAVIEFEGTTSDWTSISRESTSGYEWNSGCPAGLVINCTKEP
ncbi:MAG: leucine-rich repeat domain-containing protein [Treponema sp.]|nr:leucine-rich repeat domain-containing protein [Treponema sp.]